MHLADLHDQFPEVIESLTSSDGINASVVFKPGATLQEREAVLTALAVFDFAAPEPVKEKASKEMAKDLAMFSPLIRLTIDSIIGLPRAKRQAAYTEWCGGFSAPRKIKIKAALAEAGVIVE